jgi:L-ascorbate metabolism protein UlaG (beta-lactamase superfamily)
MISGPIPTTPLAQVGFRLDFGGTIVYVDVYLSDSVRERESEDLARLLPIAMPPDGVRDADYVLITHGHRDQCDPDTLIPLAAASPQCTFIGPTPVISTLSAHGIAPERLRQCPRGQALDLGPELSVTCVPSAHPKVEPDRDGEWLYLGYLIRWRDRLLYHAGDTALTAEVHDHLARAGTIDVAFLPVNEINYFRDRRGIIGNMSVPEAFGLAEEPGIRHVVATHWDMFEANRVSPEEIELRFQKPPPNFELSLNPPQG